MRLALRSEFSKRLESLVGSTMDLPSLDVYCLIDYEVKIEDGSWGLYKKKVPNVDIDP